MKLSDYLVERLRQWRVDPVFMVTGGGAMHLNDSIGRPGGLRYLCTHHEQAAAIAAEGYARISGRPGVVCVTSGPGGTNAITGVLGAWTDSIPLVVLSGQVKRAHCVAYNPGLKLRQLGDQEIDIASIVRSITKYAHFVSEPESIRYHLEKAFFLAAHGRPGPCWLDLPLDIQSAQIDPESLPAFDPAAEYPDIPTGEAGDAVNSFLSRLARAESPAILAGSGIRQAGAAAEFLVAASRLGIPVVLSRTAHDLLPTGHPLRCGRAGIDADRYGNIVTANADLLLVLGCRLGIRQTGHNSLEFAPRAHKIHVDIDAAELTKPNIAVQQPVHADLRVFLARLLQASQGYRPCHDVWLDWCRERIRRYPAVTAAQRAAEGPLNPYPFLEAFFELLDRDDIVACGNGAAFIMTCHAGRVHPGQRIFFNSGTASMGHDLPAAIGASVAAPGRRVICVAGDGSIQMNIQELQTIAHHRLPIKLLILNNNGYLSIRTTQLGFFGNLVGESASSGVSLPDAQRIAAAYGIPSVRIESQTGLSRAQELLAAPGPALIEAVVDPGQSFEPRCASRQQPDGSIVSPPLEDMFPFLTRREMEDNYYSPASLLTASEP